MCRLAYIPKPFDGMIEWLDDMELSNGGHGSGVAIGKFMIKGMAYTAVDTGKEIEQHYRYARQRRKRALPALWHTRWTSSGGHHDELCHPFACDDGWLVHNGHWATFHEEAKKHDEPMSDTRLFSEVVNDMGFADAVTMLEPPGVWLHMRHDGKLAVWKNGGSLHYSVTFGAWGSAQHKHGEWYSVQDGFYNYAQKPKRNPIVATNYRQRVFSNWS